MGAAPATKAILVLSQHILTQSIAFDFREKLKIVPLDALPDVLNMYIWVVGEVDMILSPGFFFLALIVWTLRCHLLEQFYSLQVHTRDRYKLVLT